MSALTDNLPNNQTELLKLLYQQMVYQSVYLRALAEHLIKEEGQLDEATRRAYREIIEVELPDYARHLRFREAAIATQGSPPRPS